MRAWIVVAACAFCGCKSESPAPVAGPAAQTIVVAPAPSPDVATQPPPPVAPTPAKVGSSARIVRAGWSTITLHDKAPFCVFEGFRQQYETRSIRDVKKPKLRASSKVVFGAFAPTGVSDACASERPGV